MGSVGLRPFFSSILPLASAHIVCDLFYREIISSEEAKCVAETSEMIAKLFGFEKKPPYYYLNKSGFDTLRSKWFDIEIPTHSLNNGRIIKKEHEVMAEIHAYLQIASQVSLAYTILQMLG